MMFLKRFLLVVFIAVSVGKLEVSCELKALEKNGDQPQKKTAEQLLLVAFASPKDPDTDM